MAKGVFVYSDELLGYDLGPEHPLKPERLRRTVALLRAYGVLDNVTTIPPTLVPHDRLLEVHSSEFVDAVDRLSSGERAPYPHRYGFGSGDNPIFPGMYEASLLYTGATLQAAQAITSGSAERAMTISGGLHHAHYAKAAGFCIFNDCAVGIRELRRKFGRVVYIDIDVHHGDGVEEMFYDDPSVMTVSIHQSGRTLFPGGGFVEDLGEGEAKGYSVNAPVWPGTEDETWLEVFREALLPVINAFEPEAVLLQLGTDAHFLDPLGQVALTAQGWLEAVKDVLALNVPVVAVGGGGYNLTTVPRMWTSAFAQVFGLAVVDQTPVDYGYRSEIPTLSDVAGPKVSELARAEAKRVASETIVEVKRLVFPYHGLR